MLKKLVIVLVLLGFVISGVSYMTGFVTFDGIENPFYAISGDISVSMSIATDTEIYHSGEYMEARVSTASNRDMESAIIKFYGIQNRVGSYEVNEEQIVKIKAPGKETTFLVTMPRCYGCAGVEPGAYEMTVELIYNNQIISSSTKTIELVK